ncbi:unnamed protein product [Fraxinus pennsylvanica]|uniref:Uncharacterized protein n=1 Tax=Fraxinus pennsylvanica TaxID=56036 RepID=A0AAD2AD95_9LAMI|nr:unnamed protein product [Fraxinus pennsylvanica]
MASSSDQNSLLPSMKLLPSAFIATIMTKLDIRSIHSLASTCIFITMGFQLLGRAGVFHLMHDVQASHSITRSTVEPIFAEYIGRFKIESIESENLRLGNLQPIIHGTKCSAWEIKVTPNQNSLWGAVTTDEKMVANTGSVGS